MSTRNLKKEKIGIVWEFFDRYITIFYNGISIKRYFTNNGNFHVAPTMVKSI